MRARVSVFVCVCTRDDDDDDDDVRDRVSALAGVLHGAVLTGLFGVNLGGLPGVGLNVDDCRATHADLVAKGVEFLQEPQDRPYGVEALMRDNSGNWIVLVEPKAYSEADFEGFDPS